MFCAMMIVIFAQAAGGIERPPDPYIEMDTADFLLEFKMNLADRGSGFFNPLVSPAEQLRFCFLAQTLRDGDLYHAADIVADLESDGCHYRLFRLNDTAMDIFGFMESVSPGHPDYRGWGTVLVRPGSVGHVMVQAPHVKYEVYTEEIALLAFLSNPNAVVLIMAGTHRYASDDLDFDGEADSDVAHDPHSLFHPLTLCLAQAAVTDGSPYWIMQFHGAYDRASEPDVVLSNGAEFPFIQSGSPLVAIDDAVDAEGYLSMGVCGWFENPNDAEDGVYELTATSNIQGRALARAGLRESFMHFEIERHTRNAFHSGVDPGFTGVLMLLDDIAAVLGTAPAPTPIVQPGPEDIPVDSIGGYALALSVLSLLILTHKS